MVKRDVEVDLIKDPLKGLKVCASGGNPCIFCKCIMLVAQKYSVKTSINVIPLLVVDETGICTCK